MTTKEQKKRGRQKLPETRNIQLIKMSAPLYLALPHIKGKENYQYEIDTVINEITQKQVTHRTIAKWFSELKISDYVRESDFLLISEVVLHRFNTYLQDIENTKATFKPKLEILSKKLKRLSDEKKQ